MSKYLTDDEIALVQKSLASSINISQIARETGINRKKIYKWLREQADGLQEKKHKCLMCGRPVSNGTWYCQGCRPKFEARRKLMRCDGDFLYSWIPLVNDEGEE